MVKGGQCGYSKLHRTQTNGQAVEGPAAETIDLSCIPPSFTVTYKVPLSDPSVTVLGCPWCHDPVCGLATDDYRLVLATKTTARYT